MYTDCNYKETNIEQVGKGCDEMMNAVGIIESVLQSRYKG